MKRVGWFLLAVMLCLPSSLAWAQPAQRRAALEAGLVATYSSGGAKIVRLAYSPNFALAEKESIHPQIGPDFTLAYDGVIRILTEGDYAFDAGPDAKVAIDSKPAAKVHLTAGDHPFHLDYTRKAGPARLQLTWSSAAFPAEPMPPSVLGHASLPPSIGATASAEHGRLLAQELNCVACHKPSGEGLAGRPAPDLNNVGSRLSASWIFGWLENPRHFRPAALMPAVLKDEQERRDVATYLASLKDATTARPAAVPDADAAKAGREVFEAVGCLNCHSASGPSLSGMASKWVSPQALSRYLTDPLATDPSGRMPSMLLDRAAAQSLAAFLFTSDGKETKAPDQTAYTLSAHLPEYEADFKAGDGARGKTLLASAGCMNCHSVGAEPRPASPQAKELAKLDVARGCLAAQPSGAAAQYGLSPEERSALAAYINSTAKLPEVAAAPVYAYQEDIRRFNCVACHTAEGFAPRQTLDGVPPLSIAGQKLRPEWIKAVLEDKQRVRPWLKLHMPHFGPAVAKVKDELIAVAGAGPVEDVATPSGAAIRDGRKLAANGAGSLACVTCHAFNGSAVAAPEQSRGPEMTLMVTRLRPDYFRRWMREPGRIVPNTVMPAFFTDKTPAESAPIISALWSYLSLGKGMPLPDGILPTRQAEFVLTPVDVPLVQRCYLDGGGMNGQYRAVPRAIAVGLPGLTSYVFDPDLCQLDYAWAGGFVDMTKGWTGRGDTHGRRLGTPFYNAPPGSPIYIGALDRKPVMDYRGYSIVGDQVEMIYAVDGIEVRERCAPAATSPGIVRTFGLDPAGKPVYFVVQEDAALNIAPSAGTFQSVPTPAGWETAFKARATKLEPKAGKLTFSISIRPAPEGK